MLRVLYLGFNEGYSGDVDLAAEAIRLTRQLTARVDHPEAGLLALMLLHHARRSARTAPDGLVPLAEQDRGLWDTEAIAEGVAILQLALSLDRLGEFQAQAAVAALHADARTAEETDRVQIVEWYDELVRLTGSPVVRLNRAVAVGEADGPRAGLAALAELDASAAPGAPDLPRRTAVAAYLHERDGGAAVRGGRPQGAEPRGTRPSDASGRAAQRARRRLTVGGRAGAGGAGRPTAGARVLSPGLLGLPLPRPRPGPCTSTVPAFPPPLTTPSAGAGALAGRTFAPGASRCI